MKSFFPAHFAVACLLVLIQSYLLVYFAMFLLRRLKLLKKPYGGMDYSEALPATFVILGVLLVSSGDIPGIVQAAKFFSTGDEPVSEPFLLFFARAFAIVLIFVVFFVILNFMNIRYLFGGQFQEPTLVVSILLCAISVGLAAIFWPICREVIDNMTPKYISFQ